MKIVIIGQGGHSKVIKDIILSNEGLHLVGYLDDKFDEYLIKDEIFYGPITSYQFLVDKYDNLKFIVAIGNNQIRKKIVETLNLDELFYSTLIHPSAIISPSVCIGTGTVIMANTVINADAVIGNHVIINTGTVIEHDNRVRDFVHVSPNATITGSVQLGVGVHIGAGATLIPNINVGDWSIIGAGATVINSIPAHTTAVGVPARS